jgi:Na+-transporting NADH:ubiquinone oxidoreductase subunit NqrF
VAPPVLKPITITFSGEVASVAASENPPMITIQDRYGVKKEISVPADATVTAGTASKALVDLKAGDKVTVEYTYDVATGKRTAQTINVGDTAAAGT